MLMGLWVIVSGYLGFTPDVMATNVTISGVLISGFALWGALEHQRMSDGQYGRRERHA
ncbi:MAG: hypothetical protein V4674_02630 [Patescibacteria group bacterium]